jgi:long-chain acyl-CoA synthetase
MSMDTATQANIQHAKTLGEIAPDNYQVPFRNIRDVLALHSKVSGDKVFLIHYDDNNNRTELTYAEFVARVHQVANFLYEDLHIRRGDRIATMMVNHEDTVLIYFACWVLGATVAPQNVAEDDARIAFILRNSEAQFAFVADDYIARAENIIHGGDGSEGELGAPNIKGIVQVGGHSETHPTLREMVANRPTTFLADESGAKSGDMGWLAGNEDSARLDDEALLVYTSGTTGAPKGVVLTQYNLLIDAKGISAWQGITGNQRMMCVLPIHHVNGIVVTLITPLYVGASTVLNRAFSVHHFWERVVREQVNIVSVVPTLLQFLVEHAERNQTAGDTIFGQNITRLNLTRFRHFICGAGTLAVALAEKFEETFGFPILHGYGLSETTCYSCFLPPNLTWQEHQAWLQDYGYPSIGCPIEPNEMAIFSPDGSGEMLGEGERGEICIRGHNVMKHYYKRDDANRETFKFGWFRSGDEGFFQTDAQGRRFFFITGRIKELINRGGVKFSPFDIEEVLLAIEGVNTALAVAFENDYYGEEVGAYIVPEDGAQLDADAILAHARDVLGFAKAPKVVVFGQDIPVTSTGKYQRLKLRHLFSEHKSTQFRAPKG